MNQRIVVAAVLMGLHCGLGSTLGNSYYVDPGGNDNNSGTSWEAPWRTIGFGLSQAASGDTLLLAAGTFNEHGLVVGRDIHIAGRSSDTTIIDGQWLDRVLNVSATATVTIDNVTIRNGQALTVGLDGQPGGGIFNMGTLTLIRCRIANNRAGTGGSYHADPGPGGHGGGIYTVGTSLTMTDCEVTGNAAGDGGSVIRGHNGGDGGGIFVGAGAALIVSDSRMEGNAAGNGGHGGDGGGQGGRGGGIRSLGTATVTGCLIAGNRTGTGGGAGDGHAGNGGPGGGICNGGILTVTTTRIEGNTAGNGGGGRDWGNGGHAGGIWSDGTCNLSQSRIVGNIAGNGGGNGEGNSAAGSAGGMYASGPTSLTACQVSGNRVGVPGTYEDEPMGAPGYGGGLYLSNNTVQVVNCTITLNDGGQTGGLLATGSSCRLTIRHSTIHGNRADGTVGGIGLINGAVVTVANSIVSSNTVGTDFSDIARLDGTGTVTSLGYNLVRTPGTLAGVFVVAGDLTGQDPQLGSLGDYGGPTLSCIPFPNSPAVDRIPVDNPNLASTDQRGYSRPLGSGGDVGAIEVWPSSISTAAVSAVLGDRATCGGEVFDTGTAISARGVCWNEAGGPTVADAHTDDGAGIGVFTSQITGLSPGTTYHVRAYLVCSFGTFYGNEVTFTTNILPAVTTGAATAITGFTADVGGTVTSDGGDPTVSRGVCWAASPMPTRNDNTLDNGSGTGAFTCHLTGLAPGTLYHVRAFAVNNVGTVYGQDTTFTTDTVPTVLTGDITHISAVSANCTGEVTADGGEPVTARGLCWGTSPNPTTGDLTNDSGSNAFAEAMAPLSPATTYYVRAYAVNSVGMAYGELKSFTTLATLPDILTLPVGNITDTGAQSGGRIATDGGDAVLLRGVCWSTSSDPTTFDSATKDGTGTDEFVSTLTNLQPGTIYYVRAYASNSVGTRYGPVLAFTTTSFRSVPPDEPTPTPTPTATPTPVTGQDEGIRNMPNLGEDTQGRWLSVNIPLPYWCGWPLGVVLVIVTAGFLALSKFRE